MEKRFWRYLDCGVVLPLATTNNTL